MEYALIYQGDETQLAEDFPDFETTLCWRPAQCTQEEFLESVKGTWLDTLSNLPREPWNSPIIFPKEDYQDCYNYAEMPWQEMVEKVQSLIDEYNQLLQDGDYDIPPVS